MNKEYVNIGDTISHPSPNIRLINSGSVLSALQSSSPDFKIVHATDFHLKNNSTCNTRLPLLKTAIAAQTPDYIFATGDMIDAQGGNSDQTTMLGTLLTDLNAIAPTYVARGNHDCALTNGQLSMPSNYYYVDINNWRFITLFSQQGAYEDNGNAYSINADWRYGATQIAWFSDLVATTPADMFICVITHVPLVTVSALMWWTYYNAVNPATSGVWNPTVDIMKDLYPMTEIFRQNPKIKICLSGHEHVYSEETYLGVKYVNSGAVCANWWNDTSYEEKHCPAGFRTIGFFEDGSTSVGPMLTY